MNKKYLLISVILVALSFSLGYFYNSSNNSEEAACSQSAYGSFCTPPSKYQGIYNYLGEANQSEYYYNQYLSACKKKLENGSQSIYFISNYSKCFAS